MNEKKKLLFSSEPGYYEDGEFGIRIEDIVQIVEAETKNKFKGTHPPLWNQTKNVFFLIFHRKQDLALSHSERLQCVRFKRN